VTSKHGTAVVKTCRSVLSGMCSFACRRDLLDHNPFREVSRISVKPQKATVAMDVVAIVRLRKWLVEDEQSRDLPDLISFLAATGCRIGEALALRWRNVDLDEHTIEVRGTVLRIKGGGLIIKSSPKTPAGQRLVELPSWTIAKLRDRHDLAVAGDAVSIGDLQVFPAPQAGGLRDPSNTRKVLRSTFERGRLPGPGSRAFRAALGTLMDQSGRTARNIAPQLGYSKPSFSRTAICFASSTTPAPPNCSNNSTVPERSRTSSPTQQILSRGRPRAWRSRSRNCRWRAGSVPSMLTGTASDASREGVRDDQASLASQTPSPVQFEKLHRRRHKPPEILSAMGDPQT
jgi:hypothetical protein